MATVSFGAVDGHKALSMFGVAAAAVIGFTVQPMLAIADPIALLITGFLVVLCALGIAAVFADGDFDRPVDMAFEFIFYAALVSMIVTVGDAWIKRSSINATCAKLQHVMLYEHRRRTDVPDIFRTLGCKIQP
jgi:hypothetical protein